jgi:chromosome segregation ATPase
MQRITVSLDERHVYELKARQRLGDADSRSAAVRDLFDEYAALEAEYEELHTEYEALEAEYAELRNRYEAREDRIEDLEAQLRERSRVEDKIEDLPDKIRSVGTYQERRQRLLDQASLTERVKWKITGVPVQQLDDPQ